MSHKSRSILQPGVVVVEVLLGRVIRLVRHLVQLEDERQVCETPHLHLRCLGRVPT